MRWGSKQMLSLLRFNPIQTPSQQQQCRTIVKVRLKWVKNKSIDHVIDIHTDLKAAYLLKDAIIRSSAGYLSINSIEDLKKLLGLTVPTLRFLRRYPTLFKQFPHPKYASLPCFKLTNIALNLHNQEQLLYQNCEDEIVERLCRVLMMTRDKMVPFKSLYYLKWDLGLPDDFDRNLIRKYPDCFCVVKGSNGLACLKLLKCDDGFAVSELQRRNEDGNLGVSDGGETELGKFKRGQPGLAFPMSFPRGYGERTKVKAWMNEFQKLPYISPYEDSRDIDPNSDLMDKRVVGVLHEFLSLTVYKKTKRNNFRSLREELDLPHRFTRIFTRYPGIFYLSLKCKTTTVALREGYYRGKLENPSPLSKLRDKFYYVMRTGIMYRNKGVDMIPELNSLATDDVADAIEQDKSGEEEGNDYMSEDVCYTDGSSELEGASSEED